MKKVLAVASQGGHSVQLMRLKPVLDQYETHYVSSQKREGMGKFTKVIDANRNTKFALVLLSLQMAWIVLRFRPDVVVSSGAVLGFIAIFIGKCLGASTLWIDSIANADEMSLSGQYAEKFSDLWLTQWEKLAQQAGPRFEGKVI